MTIHTIYHEIIAHYTCGNCSMWWSVATESPFKDLTRKSCPHCGTLLEVREQNLKSFTKEK